MCLLVGEDKVLEAERQLPCDLSKRAGGDSEYVHHPLFYIPDIVTEFFWAGAGAELFFRVRLLLLNKKNNSFEIIFIKSTGT